MVDKEFSLKVEASTLQFAPDVIDLSYLLHIHQRYGLSGINQRKQVQAQLPIIAW
jgi:hypothetical protein